MCFVCLCVVVLVSLGWGSGWWDFARFVCVLVSSVGSLKSAKSVDFFFVVCDGWCCLGLIFGVMVVILFVGGVGVGVCFFGVFFFGVEVFSGVGGVVGCSAFSSSFLMLSVFRVLFEFVVFEVGGVYVMIIDDVVFIVFMFVFIVGVSLVLIIVRKFVKFLDCRVCTSFFFLFVGKLVKDVSMFIDFLFLLMKNCFMIVWSCVRCLVFDLVRIWMFAIWSFKSSSLESACCFRYCNCLF